MNRQTVVDGNAPKAPRKRFRWGFVLLVTITALFLSQFVVCAVHSIWTEWERRENLRYLKADCLEMRGSAPQAACSESDECEVLAAGGSRDGSVDLAALEPHVHGEEALRSCDSVWMKTVYGGACLMCVEKVGSAPGQTVVWARFYEVGATGQR